LTSALVGFEWLDSRPCRFTLGDGVPGTHWIRGWEGLTASLDDMEKRKFLTLPGLKLRLLVRPARSQSLYRQPYYGTYMDSVPIKLRKGIIDPIEGYGIQERLQLHSVALERSVYFLSRLSRSILPVGLGTTLQVFSPGGGLFTGSNADIVIAINQDTQRNPPTLHA
jgi:hypothetical protein